MYNFEIFTDSSCDLPKELVEQYNLKVLQLEVTINGGAPVYNKDVEPKVFYHQLREGAMAKVKLTLMPATLNFLDKFMQV